jgi:CheY-like chemotaxis protein
MIDNDNELDITLYSSPVEALEWVVDNKPDCVVSDYNMPEMNGIEFTRRLRESSQIPVILYTNQSRDEVVDQAFEAGISDYVQKEYDTMHYLLLLRRIKNAVDKYRLEMQVNREK